MSGLWDTPLVVYRDDRADPEDLGGQMGFERQVKRRQLKERRKAANKAAKEIKALMDAMPGGCSVCGTAFTPRETPEQLDNWKIQATTKHATLTCDKCAGGPDASPVT